MMGGGAAGCALGGGLSLRKNTIFPVLVAASIVTAIASGLLSDLPDDWKPPPKQWALEAILGLGVGLKISSTTFLSVLQVGFEDHGESRANVLVY